MRFQKVRAAWASKPEMGSQESLGRVCLAIFFEIRSPWKRERERQPSSEDRCLVKVWTWWYVERVASKISGSGVALRSPFSPARTLVFVPTLPVQFSGVQVAVACAQQCGRARGVPAALASAFSHTFPSVSTPSPSASLGRECQRQADSLPGDRGRFPVNISKFAAHCAQFPCTTSACALFLATSQCSGIQSRIIFD